MAQPILQAQPAAGAERGGCTVCMLGDVSYSVGFATVRIQVEQIESFRSSGRDGPLYVELWVSERNTYGGTVHYTLLGSTYIGYLGAGDRIFGLDRTVPIRDLPSPGCYYIAVVLYEEGDGYKDWRLFDNCYRQSGSGNGLCCDEPSVPDDFFEPNDSCSSPRAVGFGTWNLQWQDEDWFEVEVGPQQALRAVLAYDRSQRDLDIEVRGTDCGTTLARVTSPDGSETLEWVNASGSARRVRVRVSRNSGSNGPYTLTFGQVAGCNVSLGPATASYGAEGGQGSAAVTTPSGCTWSASTDAGWIALTTSSGAGSGTVRYVVTPNLTASTRTGTITIANAAHVVTQAGSGAGCQLRLIDVTANANAAPLRTLDASQWTFRTIPAAFDAPEGTIDSGLRMRLAADSTRGTYGYWESALFGPLAPGRYELEVRLDPVGPVPAQTNYPELRVRLQSPDGLNSTLKAFRTNWADPARAYPSAVTVPFSTDGVEQLRLSLDLIDADPSVVAGGHRVVGFALRQVIASE
jgi:hypothetical protein